MARAALPGGLSPEPAAPRPGPWQYAEVVAISPETARAKTFRLALSVPLPHLAGQHVIVRLTAPDGYRASRSYSVASPPGDDRLIELTIERLEDGEVSTFLHDEVVVGDRLEIRGPIGGYFVWRGEQRAVLIGGGSGVVPLMSMLRLARRRAISDRVALVVSVRSEAERYYRDELVGPEVRIVYTRSAPAGTTRPAGRLGLEDLTGIDPSDATCFVCGPAAFCDHASGLLLAAGARADRIRIERFGPSG